MPENISIAQHDQIRFELLKSGLELIDDIKGVLIERIKKVIIGLVRYAAEPLYINLSVHLKKVTGQTATKFKKLKMLPRVLFEAI